MKFMTIDHVLHGRGKDLKWVYQLRNDTNNGGGIIANFPSLTAAALVLRFMNGGDMNDEEKTDAVAAMYAAQVTTTKNNRGEDQC